MYFVVAIFVFGKSGGSIKHFREQKVSTWVNKAPLNKSLEEMVAGNRCAA